MAKVEKIATVIAQDKAAGNRVQDDYRGPHALVEDMSHVGHDMETKCSTLLAELETRAQEVNIPPNDLI